MANHQIPRGARRIERIEGVAADGRRAVCSVYEHTRAGHAQPMFYVVQYLLTADGRIDRATRVTNQVSGRNAPRRLRTEMAATRRMFAQSTAAWQAKAGTQGTLS